MMTVSGIKSTGLLLLVFVCVTQAPQKTKADSIAFAGQFSAWAQEGHDAGRVDHQFGVRYIPEISIGKDIADDHFIDIELSLNTYWFVDTRLDEDEYDTDFYRVVLRYATPQTTTRIGLQKINFGPARILRSLRWFDRLNPTDPLQLTEGVWGGVFRYNALNNANTWFWLLYGNDDLKGTETLETEDRTPELGGRFQFPTPAGELAATLHTRKVEGDALDIEDFSENRYAVDGSWDVTVGVWFEAAVLHQNTSAPAYEYAKLITLGADYTFDIGNGPHLIVEHFMASAGEYVTDWEEAIHLSAFSVDYPLSLLDTVSILGIYVWKENAFAQYGEWRRTYDNYSFNIGLYSYPKIAADMSGINTASVLEGTGVRFMVTFNH